ncbi:hypothetical protein [Mycetocola sp. 2940]|uniref:hypothetical protein n=1 Tax=Mycetocola sp. 2940 TaxID=3156452 RepID=UPI00339391C4
MPREEIPDARPFLAIPYWSPGDTGEDRPLPSTVTWYLCAGIRTSTYQPGQVLEVSVDVRNNGGSNAPSLAQVTVWWSDPALGFVIKPENLIGFRQVAVDPRGGAATTALMARQMPADAPNHICLLARVSHPLDPAPPVPDPVNDRHWAQRNLSVVAAPAGAPVVVPFVVANPFPDGAGFHIRLAPITDPRLLVGVDGVTGEAFTDFIAVLHLDGMAGERSLEFDVELGPGNERHFEATIEVDLPPGTFAAFEFSQALDERVVGGLGVVLVAEER